MASNDGRTRFWRAQYLGGSRTGEEHAGGGRYTFRLTRAPVKRSDFGPSGALRLWEYGAGDHVRQATFVSLRRTAPAHYELTADTELALTLRGTKLRLSTDGRQWRTLRTRRAGSRVGATIGIRDLSPEGRAYLWVR